MREAAAAYAAKQAAQSEGAHEHSRHWPLWEVFVRVAPRALPRARRLAARRRTPRLALRNARDVYTRRKEGVSIWVVPSADDRRVAARTSATRSSTRPATRSTGTRRSTTSPRGWSTSSDCILPRRLRPRPRRRRPGLRPADGLVDQPRAAARGGRRPRQHRPRPARPGPHAARPRRRARGRRPRRGRPRLPARRARLPQRAPRRAAADRLRRRHGPAAGVLDATRPSCTPPCSAAPTRPWPASRARPSRRSPTTSTTPTSGCCASATAPTSRTPACRPRSTPSGPTSRSCSRPVDPALVEDGVAATRRRSASAVLARVAEVLDEATLAVPEVTPPARRRPPRPAHRGLRLPAGRDAAPRPLAPGGDLVMPTQTRRSPRLGAGRRGPRPRAARRHDRGPRHPARRHRGRPRLRARADHPDLLRLPGHGRPSAPTWSTRSPRPATSTSTSSSCCPRPGPPTGISEEGLAKLAAYGVAPPSPTRGGPVGSRSRCAARSAAAPTPASPAASARPRASRCGCASSCREPFDHFKTL